MVGACRLTTLRRAAVAVSVGGFCILGAEAPARAATITVESTDPAGVGFNDSTPATPVGGNPGNTRGEQALLAVQFAADLWAAELDSGVPIIVEAQFAPLDCTATTANLGSGIPSRIVKDLPGLVPDTWYPIALANRISGQDLLPGAPDIEAKFNGGIGASDCLAGPGWYFGFDSQGGNQKDLVDLAVHELAHGLGMTTFADPATGALQEGTPDIYSRFVFDKSQGATWADMATDADRAASARNARRVVWSGENVQARAATLLDQGFATLSFGPPLEDFDPPIGLSPFGPGVPGMALTAALVVANDGTVTVTDACEPLADVSGSAVLIDGGGCPDVDKVLAAQAAGAVFAILIDDATAALPRPLTGDDGGQVTIPAIRVSLDDGAAIHAALPSLDATLWVDPDRLVGADRDGRPYLYASDPVKPGRTLTHWDPIASPDLLMEPDVIPRAEHGVDLARALLIDIGWEPFTGDADAGAPDAGATSMDASAPLADARVPADAAIFFDSMAPPAMTADGEAAPMTGETGLPLPSDDGAPRVSADAGSDGSDIPGGGSHAAAGCGCRAAQPHSTGSAWLALWGVALLWGRRRRVRGRVSRVRTLGTVS